MKKVNFILIISFISLAGLSQEQPVNWSFHSKKIDPNTYEVYLTASIENGWHIYSQVLPEDAIAQPTLISFAKSPVLSLTGKPLERGKKEKQQIKELDITQYYYADKVVFVQTVKLKAKVKTNITGTVVYMACTNDRCLPPASKTFSLQIGGEK
jgi:DsbC/DsbD-like thiol-disulfide interchange protein